MILKIERYHSNPILQNKDWWLLDDIRKINKYEFNHPFKQEFDASEANIFILDYEDHLKHTNSRQYSRQYSRNVVRLVCRLSNGDEFSILLDTIAYILNDSGKTIEKIVGNYR